MREKIYTVREGKKCLSHDIVALSCDICALSHDICEFILYHHNYAYVDDIGHAIGDWPHCTSCVYGILEMCTCHIHT